MSYHGVLYGPGVTAPTKIWFSGAQYTESQFVPPNNCGMMPPALWFLATDQNHKKPSSSLIINLAKDLQLSRQIMQVAADAR